jgi:hypothetical protein
MVEETIPRCAQHGDCSSRRRPQGLRQVAAALIAKAIEGDMQAIRELADRTDGKVAQVVAGDPEQPLSLHVIIGGDKDADA